MELAKIPPHDIEAEQAVIGSMLTDSEAVMSAVEKLRADSFYREDNKLIFEAIVNGEEEFLKSVEDQKLYEELIEEFSDIFGLSDVNSDGYVSENEFLMVQRGVDYEYGLSEAEKAAKKTKMQEHFNQVDKNSDKKLDKDEYKVFLQKQIDARVEERQEKIRNIMSKSPKENMAEIQKQMDGMKDALEKLNNTSSDEMADNFIKSVSNNLADENYFQMDKNKDGCVTEDEYVEYMTVFASDNKEDEGKYPKLSEDDWRNIYQFEKKSKENCLTKEEYMRNYLETPDMSVVESDTAASELLTDKKVVK